MIDRIYKALSSRSLSIFLLVSVVVWAIFLGAWAVLSPPHVVQAIAELAPFWILGGALVINLLFCMITIFSLVRRRLSTLGTIIFHFSIIVVLAGFMVSKYTRFTGNTIVARGQIFRGTPKEYMPPLYGPRAKKAPQISFGMMKIEPEFYQDMLLFTSLKAQIGYPEFIDGKAFPNSAWIKINKPVFMGLTSVRLIGYGFAPLFIIKDYTGKEIDGGFVNLRSFPPGMEDFIIPQFLPYKIFVRIFPDATVKDGKVINRTNNLVSPVVVARVVRGKLVLFDGPLQQGESAKFEGFELLFPEIRGWGEVQIIHDPGMPVILAGLVLLIIGLSIKFVRWRVS